MSTPTRIVVGARETIRLAASGRASVAASTAAAQGVAGPTGPAGPLRDSVTLMEAIHGNMSRWPIFETFNRDGQAGETIATLQSGQDVVLATDPAEGVSVAYAELNADGYLRLQPSPTGIATVAAVLVERPANWWLVGNNLGGYAVHSTQDHVAVSHWRRLVILAWIDADNWLGVAVGNYSSSLISKVAGVETNLGSIWSRGSAASGGTTGNRPLITVRAEVAGTTGSHSAIGAGVSVTVNGETLQSPIALGAAESIFFSEGGPTVYIGVGAGTNTRYYGFAARGSE